MTSFPKCNFPAANVRRFLEPGPIVLIGSAHKGKTNIKTCGWHMMMGYDLIGCYIWSANHSHRLIAKSQECASLGPSIIAVTARS